jgi:hypothetical protein
MGQKIADTYSGDYGPSWAGFDGFGFGQIMLGLGTRT